MYHIIVMEDEDEIKALLEMKQLKEDLKLYQEELEKIKVVEQFGGTSSVEGKDFKKVRDIFNELCKKYKI